MVRRGGGPVPRSPGISTKFCPGVDGGVLFNIWCHDAPLVECGVALADAQAPEIWGALTDLAAKVNEPHPTTPPPTPWLSVLLLPSIRGAPRAVVEQLADLERCIAWTVIEMDKERRQ